jgi:ubiquinone/menaquinone biosynthesis C-methylase UbiE
VDQDEQTAMLLCVRADLLSLFCCPADRSESLRLKATEREGGEVLSGHIRCDVCEREYPIRGGIPHFVVYAAHATEVLAAKERERAARDRDAPRYDKTVSPRHTAIELDAIVSALRPTTDEIVVDLGAGTGRLTAALAREGATVVAIDLSPASLQLNRRKCAQEGLSARVCHLVADAGRLPLRESAVDKLASGMLLEHINPDDERRRCVEEINRVLRPDGRAAMTVYNYSWSQRRRGAPREGSHEGDLYFYRFERAELATMLGGFRRRRVSGILNLPGRLASPLLDRLVRAFPALAAQSSELLFAVADK